MPRPHKARPNDDPRVIAWYDAKGIFGGDCRPIAAFLGLTPQAIYNWTMVPAEHVLAIEGFTKVSRYRLRPDIFGEARRPEPFIDFPYAASLALRAVVLAEKLNVPLNVMATWEKPPAELCLKIEKHSGISRHVLRPDVFGVAPESQTEAA